MTTLPSLEGYGPDLAKQPAVLAGSNSAISTTASEFVSNPHSPQIGKGLRYNSGKTRYDLVPLHLLRSTAKVLEMGEKKYHRWNWADGMPFSVVIGCIKRHLAAIEQGEDLDPESGERHVGHIMCNMLFLEHYMNMIEIGVEGADKLDDRPKIFEGQMR